MKRKKERGREKINEKECQSHLQCLIGDKIHLFSFFFYFPSPTSRDDNFSNLETGVRYFFIPITYAG